VILTSIAARVAIPSRATGLLIFFWATASPYCIKPPISSKINDTNPCINFLLIAYYTVT
jgi:hypothetical protein